MHKYDLQVLAMLASLSKGTDLFKRIQYCVPARSHDLRRVGLYRASSVGGGSEKVFSILDLPLQKRQHFQTFPSPLEAL